MPLSCLLHFPLSSSATNQPMSQVGRLFGRDQPQQVLKRIDLPLEPSDVLKNDHSCLFSGPVVGGKSHGKGTLVRDDWTVYEGDFKHGYRTGTGKITFKGGGVAWITWDVSNTGQ